MAIKTFKEFIKLLVKEEMTTADVPTLKLPPYRNSGMLNPFIARRRKPISLPIEDINTSKTDKKKKKQL